MTKNVGMAKRVTTVDVFSFFFGSTFTRKCERHEYDKLLTCRRTFIHCIIKPHGPLFMLSKTGAVHHSCQHKLCLHCHVEMGIKLLSAFRLLIKLSSQKVIGFAFRRQFPFCRNMSSISFCS